MQQQPEIILSWEAPEFKYYPKNIAWYITLLIVIGLFIAYLALHHDWFGVISVIIIAGFAILFARHAPQVIPVALSDQGIHIDDSLIPYTHIKHFWIIDTPEQKALHFETTAYLNHLQSVELEDQDPEIIRAILIELLPEHPEPEENFAHRIAHRLRF